MNDIRGLEALYNLEKKNLKSKEDCLVLAIHCQFINAAGVRCVGIGKEWRESKDTATEKLPKNWNKIQNTYFLRYVSKDEKSRILLKFAKIQEELQIQAFVSDEVVANMSITVTEHVSETFNEYSSTYKNLETLCESFESSILKNLKLEKESKKIIYTRHRSTSVPAIVSRPRQYDLFDKKNLDPEQPPPFPLRDKSDDQSTVAESSPLKDAPTSGTSVKSSSPSGSGSSGGLKKGPKGTLSPGTQSGSSKPKE